MGTYYLQQLKGIEIKGQELDLELLSDETYLSFQEAVQAWDEAVAQSVELANQDVQKRELTPIWQATQTSLSLDEGSAHLLHLQFEDQTLFFYTRLLPLTHQSAFQAELRAQF